MLKKILKGQFVELKEINENDFEQIIEWRNDPEYNKYINQPYKLTLELQKKWYQKYLQDETQITYGIHLINNNKLIGTVGATDIDFSKMEFLPGRLLIDKDYRFGPYLIDTFITLYDYFFETLKFEKAYLYPVKENKAAISTDKQFGFKETIKFEKNEYRTIGGHKMIEMVCDTLSYSQTKKRNLYILSRFKNQ